MTHSIATMADVLRADPGSYGLVSGVGMHMTKHVYGLYGTEPGPVEPPAQTEVQAKLDVDGAVPLVDRHDGDATVAAYSVVHGRGGDPEWAALVCDVPGGRAYARLTDDHALFEA
jgi:acetyl-CoA C-acetyltransferase